MCGKQICHKASTILNIRIKRLRIWSHYSQIKTMSSTHTIYKISNGEH